MYGFEKDVKCICHQCGLSLSLHTGLTCKTAGDDLDFCSVDSIAGHIAVKRRACARGSILARRAQLSRVKFQRNNRFLAN